MASAVILSAAILHTVELGYNFTQERLVSLQTSDVVSEETNSMVNSEELIGATEYLTL